MSDTPQPPPDLPEEEAVSLDELAAAYAQSLGTVAEAAEAREPPGGQRDSDEAETAAAEDESAAPVEAPPPQAEEEDADDDDPCPVCPATILEAMLFVGNQNNEPLTAVRAAELMRGVSPGEIPGLVDGLNARYAGSGCPYRIVSEGAGYRLALDRRFDAVRSRFYGRVREARLSQAALDALAIVAYRQPITAEEVNRLRDHPSGHLLSQLVRRQLLRIERPEGKRRPVTYHTTDRFLELFGLESLQDLPQTEDVEGE
jgi:segregation and condensation protein B